MNTKGTASNNAPLPTKQIDWIEELYYSGTAAKMLQELSKAPDEAGSTLSEILDSIDSADNELDRESAVNAYGDFLQRIGFKAGYIIAMNIARQCYCK